MAVRFIIGRSGTGKTRYCINSVTKVLLNEKEDRALVLLVPEQATYQAERAILACPQVAGFYSTNFSEQGSLENSELKTQNPKLKTLNVLSFDRLRFLLLNRHTALRQLTDIGRQMVVQKILAENADNLQVLGRSAGSSGLAGRLADTIAELLEFAKQPQDLDELVGLLHKEPQNRLSELKFADITLVFRKYLEFVEGGFLDPDIQLQQTLQAISSNALLKGAKLWVDGFSGFTSSEMAILAELLRAAEQTHIALCLDADSIDLKKPQSADGLFAPTVRTYAQLLDIIARCNLSLEKPVVLKTPVRFAESSDLKHIERNLFSPDPQKVDSEGCVHIVAVSDARLEVNLVARQILALVRGTGLRFRDIAVIASNIDDYEHYIRAYFSDYEIPFFIDRRRPLRHHNGLCCIISALRAAAGGFSSRDIFSYLKSGFVPVEDYDVDMLENYCIAFGISSEDWQSLQDWHFDDKEKPLFDEHRVNQTRQRVIAPLQKLAERLCPQGSQAKTMTASQFTKILFDFLDTLEFGKKIEYLVNEANERKDYAAADEHRQFYDKFLDVFDEMCVVFSDAMVESEKFVSIIDTAFSQLSFALIPPTIDEVVVGSIERSRHPDLKAVFLVGTTQKQFPLPLHYDRILTDDDRCVAESAGFELSATTQRLLEERQYLAYIAFTRPCRFLYITYPAADSTGRAVCRSPFVDDVQALFNNVGEDKAGQLGWFEQADTKVSLIADKIYNTRELADFLCISAGRQKGIGRLVEDMCRDKELADIGSFVRSASSYDNQAKLDDEVVAQLFGKSLQSSATALETFAACPYHYFSRYILQLKERKEFKIEPLDLGLFYHSVLDVCLRHFISEGKNFAAATNDELKKVLEKAVAEVVQRSSIIAGFCRHSKHNTYIIASACEVLQDFLKVSSMMAQAGVFTPAFTEVGFGDLKDSFGSVQIPLSNGRKLLLRGKIDRIDLADSEGKKAAIVLDYKKTGKSFSWSKFFYGLDIQLPLYMLAVQNLKRLSAGSVAGGFFIPVEVPPELSDAGDFDSGETTGYFAFNYRARGIFDGSFAGRLENVTAGASRFYSFFVKQDGLPYGHYEKRDILKPEDFEKVLHYTQAKIKTLARSIQSGSIDIKPFFIGSETACRFCEYKSLCRFDWQINDYNRLETVGKQEALEKISEYNG